MVNIGGDNEENNVLCRGCVLRWRLSKKVHYLYTSYKEGEQSIINC